MTNSLGKRIAGRLWRVVAPTYAATKRLGLLKRKLETGIHRRETPLVVLSMGKVGTSSVAHALREACPKSPIYHIHTLQPARLAHEEKVYREHFQRLHGIHAHLLDSLFIRHQLDGGKRPRGGWRLITLVRDPLQRNLSSFFQTLNLHASDLGFAKRLQDESDASVVDDMIKYFTRQWSQERPATWFDDEVRAVFGLDVLSQPFPQEAGYGIYEGEQTSLMVIRLEDLSTCVQQAFGEFMDVQDLTLSREQDATLKFYAKAYREFRDRARFDEEFLDRIYGTQYARTFYSQEELTRFRKRWQRND